MNSAIYEGRVRHRRSTPVAHAFSFRLFMVYLDLDELDEVFRGRWLWSTRRPALAWFRRRDHLGDPALPLAEAVRDLVEHDTGMRPRGPIRLLTHLRYFGHCLNPVSFYYCFGSDDKTVETIVAEVHNTPWGERHCYVLPVSKSAGPTTRQFRFEKAFHVSPFMGMSQSYVWRFRDPGPALPVHMSNIENGQRLFDAFMVLERSPITARNLARILLRYPLMTVQVITMIYLQAARLWWKRVPFHRHPERHERSEVPS